MQKTASTKPSKIGDKSTFSPRLIQLPNVCSRLRETLDHFSAATRGALRAALDCRFAELKIEAETCLADKITRRGMPV